MSSVTSSPTRFASVSARVALATGQLAYVMFLAAAATGCAGDDDPVLSPRDPDAAEVTAVDRFAAGTGMLMVRDGNNGLPPANAPVAFDQAPFITTGLGPAGQPVSYYNFDVQPTATADIFVFFHAGESAPIAGQLNIVDVKPGSAGYSDFWKVTKVIVPTDYVANTITSREAILAEGLTLEPTENIVNCPVVPAGSTASKRLGGGSPALQRGWYQDTVINYFSFEEAPLTGASMSTSPIYVTFNTNPDQPGGGPASGFVVDGQGRTHNVLGSVPGDSDYSPLWSVAVYDNADFASVTDLASAQAANVLATGVADVNCPVVE